MNTTDVFLIPELHLDNPLLFRADSLLFYEQEKLALELYEKCFKIEYKNLNISPWIQAKLLNFPIDSIRKERIYFNLLEKLNKDLHFAALLELGKFELNQKKDLRSLHNIKHLSYSNSIPRYYVGQSNYLLARYFDEQRNDIDSAWHYLMLSKKAFDHTKVITPAHQECIEKITSFCTYKRKNLLAIRYANAMFDFKKYLPKPNNVDTARAYANRAFMMFREGDIEGTKADINEGLSYINFKNHPDLYQQLMKSNLVVHMIQWNDSLWLQTANLINENIKQTGKDYIDMNRWYGQYYTQQGKYKLAIPYLSKALDQEIKDGYLFSARYSTLCFLLSQCYENLGDYEKALYYMAKNEGFESYEKETLITHISSNKNYSFVTGLRCANIYYSQFKKTGKIDALINSKSYLDVLDQVIFGQFKVAEENAILQFYLESGQEYFHLGMDVSYELWQMIKNEKYLESFINYSDKSKNSLMYRDIQMAQKQTNLPSELILKEFTLRAAIKEEKRKGLRNNSYFNRLIDEYTTLEEEMESKYKGFVSKGLVKDQLNIQDLSNRIKSNADCAFVVDEMSDHWYFTVIKKDGISVYKEVDNTDKKSKVDSLLKILQKPKSQQSFIPTNILPKIVVAQLTHQIFYIPDGIYHRFPLNSILSDTKVKVTHMPSIRLFETFSKSSTESFGIALFAFSDKESIKSKKRTRLAELPGSYNEVMSLALNQKNAIAYTGKDATKANFIKAYQDPDVHYIHLALHGVANSQEKDDVKLFFRTSSGGLDSLYGYELLRYKSKCKKVVLSACQSGLGTYEKGEGLFSLPRYFMINGATDVQFNFWDIED